MLKDFFDQYKIYEYEEDLRNGRTKYIAVISHSGLGTHAIIKDNDQYLLRRKVDDRVNHWQNRWSKMVNLDANINSAKERTNKAQEKQKEINDILTNSLKNKIPFELDSLKDFKIFELPEPDKPSNEPKLPDKSHYEPHFNFFDKIFKSLREEKIYDSDLEYRIAMRSYKSRFEDYQKELSTYKEIKLNWDKLKADFIAKQNEYNDNIDKVKTAFLSNDPKAIEEYFKLVLIHSDYPERFPKALEVYYNEKTKILIVEYALPFLSDIPTLTEVKYITTSKTHKEIFLPDAQLSKIYDTTIYNITLRVLHELFKSDINSHLDSVIFNGWVNSINKATGKYINTCIVSFQVQKSEFIKIDLSNIDPKICFKSLRGIGSSVLSGIVAIKPIAQINKIDKRFVASQDIIDKLNEGENLAAMDWKDFEHLIREIFDKEFRSHGGEVKVTQASRDGGVDAIAFDPDPIRGRKIVIKDKRYTNTVEL